jgi:hypothetical protein
VAVGPAGQWRGRGFLSHGFTVLNLLTLDGMLTVDFMPAIDNEITLC